MFVFGPIATVLCTWTTAYARGPRDNSFQNRPILDRNSSRDRVALNPKATEAPRKALKSAR
jgi:hypothetical protein